MALEAMRDFQQAVQRQTFDPSLLEPDKLTFYIHVYRVCSVTILLVQRANWSGLNWFSRQADDPFRSAFALAEPKLGAQTTTPQKNPS